MGPRCFITALLFILIGSEGCKTRSYVCGLAYSHQAQPKDCQIINLERTAAMDTTLSLIRGFIYDSDEIRRGLANASIVGANVVAVDRQTSELYGGVTNSLGEFKYYLPPSTYKLHVNFVGYNSLSIDSIFFESGDVVEFNAILSRGYDSCTYRMKPDRSIVSLHKPTDD